MATEDAATHAIKLGGDAANCEEARRVAQDEGVALVQVLVERGLAEPDALAERLAAAVGTVVIEIGRGELDVTVLPLVGADLAWRHLLIPIAPTGAGLSVAFADPLDRAALRAIKDVTGRDIEPLVAPLGELRESLMRHYGPAPVPESPSPIAAETTQRVEGILFNASATQPVHRIEDEATMAQRHRALLLALVDAGVLTHEGYLAALHRVLGHTRD
ncbi:MAG: hypothetical protein ACI9KE_001758 [Polyangiales bacterium]|jgi:hypothetical protein